MNLYDSIYVTLNASSTSSGCQVNLGLFPVKHHNEVPYFHIVFRCFVDFIREKLAHGLLFNISNKIKLKPLRVKGDLLVNPSHKILILPLVLPKIFRSKFLHNFIILKIHLVLINRIEGQEIVKVYKFVPHFGFFELYGDLASCIRIN